MPDIRAVSRLFQVGLREGQAGCRSRASESWAWEDTRSAAGLSGFQLRKSAGVASGRQSKVGRRRHGGDEGMILHGGQRRGSVSVHRAEAEGGLHPRRAQVGLVGAGRTASRKCANTRQPADSSEAVAGEANRRRQG
jgi:hypothetical protein